MLLVKLLRGCYIQLKAYTNAILFILVWQIYTSLVNVIANSISEINL